MDSSVLYQVFAATLHPDATVRKAAEDQLASLEKMLSSLNFLLEIISSAQADLHIRQAAAVFFKNMIRRHWSNELTSFSPADQAVVKSQILPIFAHSPSTIRLQLVKALEAILAHGFPEQWPEYLPTVEAMLNTTNNHDTMHAGLLALREAIRVYRFMNGKEAELKLHALVGRTFDGLLSLGNSMVMETSLDAAVMLALIFKTFNESTFFKLDEHLRNPKIAEAWRDLFIRTLEKEDLSPPTAENDERERFPWWKTKKWACHCLNRIFTRYGNPALLAGDSKKEYLPFAEWYTQNVATVALGTYLEMLNQETQGFFLSVRCKADILNFLSDAIKHKQTWLALKPHALTIITRVIFPMLCHSEEDEFKWINEVTEYVYEHVDPMRDYESPISAAMNLLEEMSKDRAKVVFLPLLQFINEILMRYLDTPVEQRAFREKDGALNVVGVLSKQMMAKKSPVRAQMEEFVLIHIVPEFRNPLGFMRARALYTLFQFDQFDFISTANIKQIFEVIMEILQNDQELPVKVNAAIILRPLLQVEAVGQLIIPHLGRVIQELMFLTRQLDVDILTTILEEIVETFTEQLQPHALQLCEQLREAFLSSMNESVAQQNLDEEYDEEFSSKISFASGCLRTINTLIVNLELEPPQMLEIETALIPMLAFVLKNSITALYDETFEIIDACTYTTKCISPNMWQLFELIYQSFKEYSVDYMEVMLPSLDNFVSYGTNVVLEHPQIQLQLCEMIELTIKSEAASENDKVSACKLMESMMLNLRGAIDQFVPSFLLLTGEYLQNLEAVRSTAFRIYLIEVYINGFLYNPVLTFNFLEQKGWTSAFFQSWFQNLDHFNRVHDKKLQIMALCSIFNLPDEQIPECPRNIWPQVMKTLAHSLKTLPEAIERREKLEEFDSDLEGSDDGFDEDGADGSEGEDGGDDQNVENYKDRIFLEMLANEAANNQPKDGESDVDDDDDQLLEEELLFESPLDKLDVYIEFRNMLQRLELQRPPLYGALTQGLSEEEQQVIREVIMKANSNEAEQQQTS